MWLWVVVIVVVIGAVVVIAVGRDDAMAEVYDDRPDVDDPDRPPAHRRRPAATCGSPPAVRGYRMDEVDAFIARIQADLLAREHRDARPSQPERAGRPSDEAATSGTGGRRA